MKTALTTTTFLFLVAMSMGVLAQARGKTNKLPAAKPQPAVPVAAAPSQTPTPKADTPAAKRNERPGVTAKPPAKAVPISAVLPYRYVFTRPGFAYSRIEIEHDDAGIGQISFQKSSFDESIVDAIELSPATVAAIKDALAALNFLDSAEEYQVARDFSHMGNVEIKVNRDGRQRSVRYNWTENKHAKFLMDEYRRIGNEYTWRFEIILARQNQPLLTPGLVELIESYVKRGEITDPPHLVPFLTELSLDERLPLMARNRTAKLIKEIEKAKKP